MRDELFHTLPLHGVDVLLGDVVQALAESADVLDQDVVARDHHLGRFLWLAVAVCVCASAVFSIAVLCSGVLLVLVLASARRLRLR